MIPTSFSLVLALATTTAVHNNPIDWLRAYRGTDKTVLEARQSLIDFEQSCLKDAESDERRAQEREAFWATQPDGVTKRLAVAQNAAWRKEQAARRAEQAKRKKP